MLSMGFTPGLHHSLTRTHSAVCTMAAAKGLCVQPPPVHLEASLHGCCGSTTLAGGGKGSFFFLTHKGPLCTVIALATPVGGYGNAQELRTRRLSCKGHEDRGRWPGLSGMGRKLGGRGCQGKHQLGMKSPSLSPGHCSALSRAHALGQNDGHRALQFPNLYNEAHAPSLVCSYPGQEQVRTQHGR
jgi:hypothetical protein